VPRKTVLQYLTSFSKINGLGEITKYDAKVSRATKTPEGSWKVEVETLKHDRAHQTLLVEHTEEVRTPEAILKHV
jgi:hypothetical protein